MATLSVSNSDIKVANAALNELGINPITSFTDGNKTARTINMAFADVVEEALSLYPWRFARATRIIQRLSKTPPPEWEGVFGMPTEAVALQKVWVDDGDTKFDTNADGILVNVGASSSAVVKADITIYMTADKWPGFFRRGFIFYLASALAMPLTQDENLAVAMEKKAMARIAVAKSRESQARTAPRIDTKTFIRQRRTGGRG